MTDAMKQQVADCKTLKGLGQTADQMRANGYAEAAILAAFGRDADSVDPYKGAGDCQ